MNYSHKGASLSPTSAEFLIKCIYSKNTLEYRENIISNVVKKHYECGGGKIIANPTGTVKKALSDMKKKGIAQLTAVKGRWLLFPSDEIDETEENISTISIENEDELTMTESKTEICYYKENIIEDQKNQNTIIYGEGNEYVYMYWFPTYEKHAKDNSQNIWPCKIGRTERDVITRINSQCGTSSPEKPIIGIIIKTSQSARLERIFHEILKFRGKHQENAVGVEWFITSPEELLKIYFSIL